MQAEDEIIMGHIKDAAHAAGIPVSRILRGATYWQASKAYRPAHGGYPWVVPLRQVVPGLVQTSADKNFYRNGWMLTWCPSVKGAL